MSPESRQKRVAEVISVLALLVALLTSGTSVYLVLDRSESNRHATKLNHQLICDIDDLLPPLTPQQFAKMTERQRQAFNHLQSGC